MHFRIKKGLDIPIAGEPESLIDDGRAVETVALLGRDVPGLKPSLLVDEGDQVRLGQPIFVDKRNPDVPFTAPASGRVAAIHRGARRFLQAVVIRVDKEPDAEPATFDPRPIDTLTGEQIRQTLQSCGLWPALRARPFGHVPGPADVPDALFINAMDTNPLAADPVQIISDSQNAFASGIAVLDRLSGGTTWVCQRPDAQLTLPTGDSIRPATFDGPHPAGLPGTHIHLVSPVGANRTAWYIGYQDVIAVGQLFLTGHIPTERIVALGGPKVKKPRLLRTRVGASLRDLLADETTPGSARVVSGSLLSGHRGSDHEAWLGRYHNQVCVVAEGSDREFMAWMMPGSRKYSALRAYVAHLLRNRQFDLTSSQNGSPRAMVSIGSFERVMPLDVLATPLLKSLLVRDTDAARDLGCLELEEEDLALCSFVCNGKYDYGPHLRRTLDMIEAGD